MGEALIELTSTHDDLDARLVEPLRRQREAWEARPAVRALYADWYAMIVARMAEPPGDSIELGCGIGTFKELCPQVVATDVAPTPWADRVADAERLPVADASVANLVMTDVLHHLPSPALLFDEAERVLRLGGRLVAVEPYCSLLSGFAYRRFHREGADPGVDPFAEAPQSSADPLDANNALPTLIFWRHLQRFRERWPALVPVERRRFAYLAYPLSGGFEGRRLAPDLVVGALRRIEPALAPLAPLAAFRCLVVLERR
ncbi:MAG: class I SAM-dependent methyltransferase [Solirubrobacterales bacterium]